METQPDNSNNGFSLLIFLVILVLFIALIGSYITEETTQPIKKETVEPLIDNFKQIKQITPITPIIIKNDLDFIPQEDTPLAVKEVKAHMFSNSKTKITDKYMTEIDAKGSSEKTEGNSMNYISKKIISAFVE